tara:strand:+ start:155 stop:610 length:456 start_codon:yes stop_codon:yes gene_type:complete
MRDTKPAAIEFWHKPLAELSEAEWESLCDGCGRCCLKKLMDDETEEIVHTRVVCKHHDQDTGGCGCYQTRTDLVPDCLDVKAMDIASATWMPATCAYRLRHAGKPLFAWHPLLTGSRDAMITAGISLSGRAISEEYVHLDGYDEHIVRWVE